MPEEKSPIERLYDTARWDRCQRFVIEREHGICERCHKVIEGRFIIHHKKLATMENFFDLDNLQLLCIECHNYVTFVEGINRTAQAVNPNILSNVPDLLNFPDK